MSKWIFAKFVMGPGTPPIHTEEVAVIGGYVVGWKDGVRNQDGTSVNALGDLVVVPDSDVSIAGNFSVGTFHLDVMKACTTDVGEADGTALVVNETKDMATLDGLVAVEEQDATDPDGRYLCISVDEDNEAMILPGDYTATVTLAKVSGRAFDPMAGDGELIGRIMRNGTTVHIPLVTTHSSYRQRIILTNRAGDEDDVIEYSIMVMPEEDNGATPTMLDGATGMLPANTTRIMLTSDVVEFADDGNPRGSATLTANAPPSELSVSTSLLNMGDGSTDTMQHAADMMMQ